VPAVTPRPHLTVGEPTSGPVRAIALVLHGGQSASTAPVRANQLAVLRMLPFATSLARAGSARGLAVARLRFAVRGWNGAQRSPVADATWAVAQLAEHFPGVPVALIGHSMGGRTALYVAGGESVIAVVALAPWVEADDPVAQLAGRRVLIAHGENDRMTSARASEAYAARAETAGAAVTYVRVRADGHAMLRRRRLWHELTTDYVMGAVGIAKAVPGERSMVV
jgi:dienelactone hydrolase